MWQPGPPATDLALAGAELVVNISRVAVPRRQGARARGDVRHARARQRVLRRVLQRRRRPGRADLRRPLVRARRRGRGASRARPGSRRRCSSSTSSPRRVIGRRLRDVRRRALARERETAPPVHGRARRARRAAGERRAGAAARSSPFEPSSSRCGSRSSSACATTSEERLPRRRRRRLRRDRLGADGGARRRGARRRARALRLDAVALLLRGDARATRGGSPRASAADFRELPIEPIVEAFTDDARATTFAGREPDLDRGEPPGPRPRRRC